MSGGAGARGGGVAEPFGCVGSGLRGGRGLFSTVSYGEGITCLGSRLSGKRAC